MIFMILMMKEYIYKTTDFLKLKKLFNEKIEDIVFGRLKEKYNYNFWDSISNEEILYTGLALGYPIESSVAILEEW